MADIGELVVRIKADATQLQSELKKTQGIVQQSAKSMGGSVAGLRSQLTALLPAFSAVAIVQFGKSAFQSADRINDLAQRIGFMGSTLSALNVPLLQSGTNLEEFSSSINRMNNFIGEAARGSKEAVTALASIGLAVQDLQNLSPEQRFFTIAEALGAIKDQSQLTETGMNIFGRSFATLIPLIKQTEGNLRGFTDEAKKASNALTDEQLKRIDEFGDKWVETVEKLKLAMLNAMPALQLYLDGLSAIINLPENAFQAGRDLAKAAGLAANPNVSHTRPQTTDKIITGPEAKKLIDKALVARGLKPTSSPSSSSKQTTVTQEIAAATKEVKVFDEQLKQVQDTVNDVGNESRQTAILIKDYLGDAFESAIFDAKNFGSAVTGILNGVARQIARQAFIDPLSNSLTSSLSGLNLGGIFGGFFASGGSPPVGVPSIVGERGPELFVPRTAGNIVPNHAMGGTSVTVVQHNTFGSGVSRAEVASMLPALAAASKQAVFEEINRGGTAAKLVGRR